MRKRKMIIMPIVSCQDLFFREGGLRHLMESVSQNCKGKMLPAEAEKILKESNPWIDVEQVLEFRLVNQPGMLGRVARRFGEMKINIDYIYGSAMEDAKESIFIVHIAETDLDRVGSFFDDF